MAVQKEKKEEVLRPRQARHHIIQVGAVQKEKKEEVLRRLSRIEGQVRGLRRLVEEDTYCVDVLTQISSIHEALRGVGKVIMRDHLQNCVTDALRANDESRAERAYQELMDVIYKFAK